MASIQMTIYFDDPFWVGIVEWQEEGSLRAARHVFGAEPGPVEVFELVLRDFARLHAQATTEVQALARPERPRNPKRAAREAAAATAGQGGLTFAQEALRLELEQRKLARRVQSRQQSEAEEERRYQLARAKAKARHRGR